MPKQHKGPIEYETSRGYTLLISGSSPFLNDMVKAGMAESSEWGKYPTPPTYPVKLATGETQYFVHSEKTLDVTDNPEQSRMNHSLWNEYLAKCNAWDIEATYRSILLSLGNSIKLSDESLIPQNLFTWYEKKKKKHLTAPALLDTTDEDDLKTLWILVEAIGVSDFQNLLSMIATGKPLISEAAATAIGNSFPS